MDKSSYGNFEFLINPERRFDLNGRIHIENNNIFFPIEEKEIDRAEQILGYSFPDQLKQFYRFIGYGHLTTPFQAGPNYRFAGVNEILSPLVAANFSKGILFWDGQSNYMSESTYEDLEPGDLPFFEIGDSSSFLVMKLNSDNPNAVWSVFGIPITDSFEEFIWRLYYESPDFYDDIITQY